MSVQSSEEKLHAFLRGNSFRTLIKFGIMYFLWIVLYCVIAFTVMLDGTAPRYRVWENWVWWTIIIYIIKYLAPSVVFLCRLFKKMNYIKILKAWLYFCKARCSFYIVDIKYSENHLEINFDNHVYVKSGVMNHLNFPFNNLVLLQDFYNCWNEWNLFPGNAEICTGSLYVTVLLNLSILSFMA